ESREPGCDQKGGRGQDEERRALPEAPAKDEGQAAWEGRGVAGHEERRTEPAQGHDRRDGADDDVRGAPLGREGGQDRGRGADGQPAHEQGEVGAEGEEGVAHVRADDRLALGGGRRSRIRGHGRPSIAGPLTAPTADAYTAPVTPPRKLEDRVAL